MNKKAIAILGAIFLLILGSLGFLIFSKSGSKNTIKNSTQDQESTNTETTDQSQNSNQQLNEISETQSNFFKLSDDLVISPVLAFDNSGVAYFDRQGRLFRANFDTSSPTLQLTEKKQLAIEQKTGFNRVIWPPNSNSFMLEFEISGKKSWTYFNNSNGKFYDIPKQVFSFSFLPTGDKIFFIWSNNAGHDTINIADPNTENYKTIGEIWDKDAVVYVSPDGKNVAYHQSALSNLGVVNPIILTDVEGKVWNKIVSAGFNNGVLWSPDGKKFLFGKKEATSQKYQLWLYDLAGGEVKNLGLFTTVEKVVWGPDNLNIFVAVPLTGTAGQGDLTQDTFYKVNLTTGEKVENNPAGLQIDAQELSVNEAGDKVFFRNAQDGGLYYWQVSR